jgi:hypothetical protein
MLPYDALLKNMTDSSVAVCIPVEAGDETGLLTLGYVPPKRLLAAFTHPDPAVSLQALLVAVESVRTAARRLGLKVTA